MFFDSFIWARTMLCSCCILVFNWLKTASVLCDLSLFVGKRISHHIYHKVIPLCLTSDYQ